MLNHIIKKHANNKLCVVGFVFTDRNYVSLLRLLQYFDSEDDSRAPQFGVTCIIENLVDAFLSFQPIPGLYDAFHKGDFCNNIHSVVPAFGVIIGLLPLIGQAVYTTESHQGTVIGSDLFHNFITLYIGTKTGYVLEVLTWNA